MMQRLNYNRIIIMSNIEISNRNLIIPRIVLSIDIGNDELDHIYILKEDALLKCYFVSHC